MPFAAIWMGLEVVILREVSQTEKERYRMISLICGTQIHDTSEFNLQNGKRLTDLGNKLTVAGEKWIVGGWHGHGHAAGSNTENQQGPAVQPRSSAQR